MVVFFDTSVFESSVNSEGIETKVYEEGKDLMFESSVNSEGIETYPLIERSEIGLRAV